MPTATLLETEVNVRVQHMLAGLRAAGLRMTPQRLALCRALAGTERHPTAQALFEKLAPDYPSLSRATVYNTLEALVSVGVAQQLVEAGQGVMHYDANLEPHAHLVCTHCGRIEDYDDPNLDTNVRSVSRRTGYVLAGLCTFYYGKCPDCRKQKS
jgi:Fur family transcriptional regulator, peroxide stress response regulator